MILQNSAYIENGKRISLSRGKIQLQSEAAEVFYKEIKIKELTHIPEKYASLFVK
jgi:hypothetical protein